MTERAGEHVRSAAHASRLAQNARAKARRTRARFPGVARRNDERERTQWAAAVMYLAAWLAEPPGDAS